MKILKYLCVAVLNSLMVYWFNISIPVASASSEFNTSFESTYIVEQKGTSQITHVIKLKNNLAHIYATNYTLATSGDKLQNITVTDETGELASKVTVQEGMTTITMAIDRPSIGKDQVKTISISYSSDEVVEQIGNTYTINIPRLERANEAENYTRIIKVAGVRGMQRYISPKESVFATDEIYDIYTFSGHQNDSLSLLFGDSVTYKLDLTYELKNSELSSVDSELSLPPDTPYQSIILDSLSPAPSSMRVDDSGNWLARYPLKSQEKIRVNAVIYARVMPLPMLYDPSLKKYIETGKSKYWQSDNGAIEALGKTLKTPENIYKYLVETFSYDYSSLSSNAKRLGAQVALKSPSNVLCTEFTDAFVALARSQNVGAREINGYGYTKNSALQPQNIQTDILHAWPEYLDPASHTWISIDPTWGNTTGGVDFYTKLDFSHIAFVRHGEEDSYPLPAGAYKSNFQDKFVNVSVATDIPERIEKLEQVDMVITNTGNVAVINDQVGYLPPYGSVTLKDPKRFSLYDKIKEICAKLLSMF